MFSHVTIGSSDPNKAAKFYDAVLGTLGISVLFNIEGAVAYGQTTGAKTFILKPFDGGPPVPGNGGHVAYLAASRAHVDTFYAKALEHGGTDEGAPGLNIITQTIMLPMFATQREIKFKRSAIVKRAKGFVSAPFAFIGMEIPE